MTAERGFQAALDGGCSVPAAAYATVHSSHLTIDGWIASPDGQIQILETSHGNAADAEQIGRELAARMLEAGGRAILEGLRK